MADEEGAICDECGDRIKARGCCATYNALRRVAGAAVAMLETLGMEDGYFPTAGAPITRELKNAVKAAGYKVRYGKRALGR